MGRTKLEIPNLPINASIPGPLKDRLELAFLQAPEGVNRAAFVASLIFHGLETLDIMGQRESFESYLRSVPK